MSDITLPELGEGIDEATIINIFVSPGDIIKKEQSVIEIETDKAALELPSPVDGTISEILVSNGDVIKIGALIAKVAEGGAPGKEKPALKEKKKEEPEIEKKAEEPVAEKEEETVKEVKIKKEKALVAEIPNKEEAEPDNVVSIRKEKNKVSVPASPSTRKLARELGIDINSIPGTDPGGRISSDDVIKYAKNLIANFETTAETHRGTYQPNIPALP